ncbi:zinc ribbon domain-containing protein [uncultured Methanobrevibacter sp.]|uniref:zinc ribbon domain-containing protein n=1 Tax=uncultured Methanobrevibacter sp. TaxID=253161 RepID=UPI0025DE88AD|nr:zinc ribbon domain-containing protein [uncultured Methanobrevibacter sp.]
MSKTCPKCGKQVPDDARFCMDCGYSFIESGTASSVLSNGRIFLVIIAVVVILGLIVIGMSGNNNNADAADKVEDASVVDLTITDVGGYDSSSGKKSYTLYTEALFNKVPDDLKGYNVKTTYYDSNDTRIGHETETLENVYYDSEYSLMFGYYTTYKLPDPDHVTVEIIKDGKTVDSFTEDIDKNKIDYLN